MKFDETVNSFVIFHESQQKRGTIIFKTEFECLQTEAIKRKGFNYAARQVRIKKSLCQ